MKGNFSLNSKQSDDIANLIKNHNLIINDLKTNATKDVKQD